MKEQLSHLGVYGVLEKSGHLLVIKKSRGVYTGLFDLPGGTPEYFESFEETLKREMLEETGLTVYRYEMLSPLLNIGTYGNTTLRHIGIIYRINGFKGNIKTDSDDQDSNGCAFIDSVSESTCTPFVCKVFLNEIHKNNCNQA